MTKAPVVGGALGWIERNLGVENRKKTRKLRVGILHGTEDLDRLAALAQQLNPDLATTLAAALTELLGVNDQIKNMASLSAMAAERPYSATLQGLVDGPVEQSLPRPTFYLTTKGTPLSATLKIPPRTRERSALRLG